MTASVIIDTFTRATNRAAAVFQKITRDRKSVYLFTWPPGATLLRACTRKNLSSPRARSVVEPARCGFRANLCFRLPLTVVPLIVDDDRRNRSIEAQRSPSR